MNNKEIDIQNSKKNISYQASSPDEIALVKFTESINLTLIKRDLNYITLLNPLGEEEVFY